MSPVFFKFSKNESLESMDNVNLVIKQQQVEGLVTEAEVGSKEEKKLEKDLNAINAEIQKRVDSSTMGKEDFEKAYKQIFDKHAADAQQKIQANKAAEKAARRVHFHQEGPDKENDEKADLPKTPRPGRS